MTVIENILECLIEKNQTDFHLNSKGIMFDLMPEWFSTLDYIPWLWAMFGSVLVGLSGILPLLVIPIDQTDDLKQGASANTLKTLLSFAVGGLLGDVFLHSLPEIWANDVARNGGHPTIGTGLLILSGLIVFVIAEKSFSVIEKLSECNSEDIIKTKNEKETIAIINNLTNYKLVPNGIKKNGYINNNNIIIKNEENNRNKKQITGYLNLLANTIDNFTHGLSLGGAFLVSLRLGLLTTFAILIHEIPHEVGDFAILLKSGFRRWDAALFQLLTAAGGLFGSFAAIMFSGASNTLEARTSWILPFTAGTFLHIALVTVLPDLLKEDDPIESFKQILALILGIFIMAIVTIVFG